MACSCCFAPSKPFASGCCGFLHKGTCRKDRSFSYIGDYEIGRGFLIHFHDIQFAIFVGGPLVGNLMDSFPRVPAFNCLNFVQVTLSP